MAFQISTPFTRIIAFENSGFATYLNFMFESHAAWLSDNLSPEDTSRLMAIRNEVSNWQEIELVHGKGAAMNLEDRAMMECLDLNPHLRAQYADELLNAERFRLHGRDIAKGQFH